MDHIATPENPRYRPLSIPYICRHSYSSNVSNIGFSGYPALRGFNPHALDVTDFDELEAFLQDGCFLVVSLRPRGSPVLLSRKGRFCRRVRVRPG